MSTQLEKLNRLRVNAGKNPLKGWKASQDALQQQIARFEADGFTDALPGANINAQPTTEDPEVIANLASPPPDPLPEPDAPPSLADSALAKNIGTQAVEPDKPKIKGRASLARGLDTDSYARHSRERVRDDREKERREKKEAKKVKLSDGDKKQIADEAASRKPKPTGAIDPKKDPAGAKRQLKHVEDKQKARAEKPAKTKNADEITVAEIARELDIDPKVARAKLRRHEDKISKLHSKGQDRWTFPMSAKAEISKILK